MCTTLVLVVLEFNKTRVLECDVLGRGIREVLMQGLPLPFTSKKLCDHNLVKVRDLTPHAGRIIYSDVINVNINKA
jgi:hypothetical protein